MLHVHVYSSVLIIPLETRSCLRNSHTYWQIWVKKSNINSKSKPISGETFLNETKKLYTSIWKGLPFSNLQIYNMLHTASQLQLFAGVLVRFHCGWGNQPISPFHYHRILRCQPGLVQASGQTMSMGKISS